MSLLDEALHDLPPEEAAEIRGKKAARPSVANDIHDATPFRTAKGLNTAAVCDTLGIINDGAMAQCPGCSEAGAKINLDNGGLKCLHARCTSKGKNGYRSNIDLVIEVNGGTAVEAVNWLAERFKFEGVRAKKVAEPNADGPAKGQGPTATEPLRGLPRLAAAAILGRDTILELAARPVVYIWQDIAIAGIIVVIAGGPSSGKTTLLFLVIVARANTGEPVSVLGRGVTPAPSGTWVVLIEAEHGDSSTARKLVRSCKLLDINDHALERIIVIARRNVRIGSPEWDEIGHMVAAGLVSDIALDTLARVAPSDGNDEREQVAIFERVAQTIERAPTPDTRPVVWTVAHTRKSETGELADVSGSTQRTGQADTVLMVTAERTDGRVTSSKVTFSKLREEPDEYPAPVEYTVTATGIVDVDRPPADDRPLEVRILERLALGPLTKTALSKALKRNKPDLEPAITNLFSTKQIATSDITIKGTTYSGFCLASTPYSTPYPGFGK